MHIDTDAAGLLAQVIPALLIVLVLEGRLPKPQGNPTIWRKAHAWFRNFTAFMSLGAEAICLMVVISNVASGTLTGSFVAISVLFLLVAVYLMLLRLIGTELRENI